MIAGLLEVRFCVHYDHNIISPLWSEECALLHALLSGLQDAGSVRVKHSWWFAPFEEEVSAAAFIKHSRLRAGGADCFWADFTGNKSGTGQRFLRNVEGFSHDLHDLLDFSMALGGQRVDDPASFTSARVILEGQCPPSSIPVLRLPQLVVALLRRGLWQDLVLFSRWKLPVQVAFPMNDWFDKAWARRQTALAATTPPPPVVLSASAASDTIRWLQQLGQAHIDQIFDEELKEGSVIELSGLVRALRGHIASCKAPIGTASPGRIRDGRAQGAAGPLQPRPSEPREAAVDGGAALARSPAIRARRLRPLVVRARGHVE